MSYVCVSLSGPQTLSIFLLLGRPVDGCLYRRRKRIPFVKRIFEANASCLVEISSEIIVYVQNKEPTIYVKDLSQLHPSIPGKTVIVLATVPQTSKFHEIYLIN